jgi:phage terminase small subunit
MSGKPFKYSIAECRTFAKAYVACGFVGKRAALEIGIPEEHAQQKATSLLKKQATFDEIQRLMQKKNKTYAITAERVLQELAYIAYMDLADILEPNGDLKPLTKIPEEARRALASLDIETIVMKKGLSQMLGTQAEKKLKRLKMHSKEKALELLGKHLGLFKESVKLEGGEKPVELQVTAVDLEERIKTMIAKKAEIK